MNDFLSTPKQCDKCNVKDLNLVEGRIRSSAPCHPLHRIFHLIPTSCNVQNKIKRWFAKKKQTIGKAGICTLHGIEPNYFLLGQLILCYSMPSHTTACVYLFRHLPCCLSFLYQRKANQSNQLAQHHVSAIGQGRIRTYNGFLCFY